MESTRKRLSLFTVCFALASAVFFVSIGPRSVHAITREQLLNQVAEEREKYLDSFADRACFLSDLEKKTPALRMENTGPDLVDLNAAPLFYDMKSIEEEIGIRPDDSPAVQVRKIFEFVRKRRKHTYPLHENSELHNPPRFFSVYGCGFCDDAASNLALLATRYGFEAKTWWLEGHVVATVFHDDKWRVYDPDNLGIVEYEGEVADTDTMVRLAKQNKLPALNDLFGTTEDNRLTGVYPDFEPDNPRIFLLPFEKRLFFDCAYMLTNDGHYLEKLREKDAFLKEYDGVLANYARIVPLQALMDRPNNENGELVLEDYFPIAGVFIRTPFTLKAVAPGALPWIHMETEVLAKVKGEVRKIVASKRMLAREISVPGGDSRYFDLSMGVGLLEPYPGRQIKLGVPDAFLKTFKDADLVTVHQYCLRNARFDKNTVNEVEQAAPSNLKIHLDINTKELKKD